MAKTQPQDAGQESAVHYTMPVLELFTGDLYQEFLGVISLNDSEHLCELVT